MAQDFTVKKVTEPTGTPSVYEFTYYRNAKDKDGNTVEVVNNTRTETLESLQAQVTVIQEKIDAIAAL